MTDLKLETLALSELFDLHACIQREFVRRGVVRTSGAIQGEIGEGLALAVYGGQLPPPGTKAYDRTDTNGRLVQVKTRTLPKGDNRMFQFHSLDFDLALCIRFDRESNDLDWAHEYDVAELRSLVSPHAQGPRLPMGRARANGRDVTATFRAAYDEFRGLGVA
ncbi:DUF6998 domain-containing protein [Arthrobacter sp. H14-L1]|uniref:DUF6998 domain-containing protein n=1 Tax=Arthrobacter sp. H14-L1 TaxID=2996697 RepID=UPI00226DB2AE|nr:hypothetical protein [Arthrobacter sp. H14-L1]MCY0906561.1 hypothetical protein [Arthrobacter sp. H14-L1]